jgi:short-subunit dehydrogenase
METAKTMFITGASSGIGMELARIAAASGFSLIISARRGDLLDSLAAELSSLHGVQVHTVTGDLAQPGVPEKVYHRAVELGGVPDVVVNNAGFGTWGAFTETDLSNEVNMLRLNIEALTIISKLALRDMVARGSGRLLNVASAAAFVPGPFMAVYYASKAYVLHFTEALSKELEGTAVTVSALCPGPVETAFKQRAGVSKLHIFRRAATATFVARAAFDGVLAGRRIIIPGKDVRTALTLSRLVPRRTTLNVVSRLQKARDPKKVLRSE